MTMNRAMTALVLAIGLSLPAQAANLSEGEWYLRLTASAGNLKDSSNVLGQLKDSKRGYDLHDLEELSPFSTPYLTIVFPHPNWGDRAGDYGSDFHGLRKRRDKWKFEVRSDDPNREVTISWSSRADMKKMKLIDTLTRKKVAAIKHGQVQSYTFNMDGQTTRSFKWVVRQERHKKKRTRAEREYTRRAKAPEY